MEYNKKVMNLFNHPKNVGEVVGASGVGQVGNPVCGDVMRISIKVKDDRIIDIKFKTMGCVAAIATSSMVTEMVKGKTIKYALKVTNLDVAKELGGLPLIKMHCSNLAADALKEAVKDYQSRKVKIDK
ncbi:Iron-sulfur cluster assembly scaffold protein IscU 2 [Candidatus Tiddalikarchaeum anstoanum]|nr:Iron-sulfur cluster assembly scaffold protein IscU 2 [Candidatus Tiddalikarchaeum anstoanum]